MLMIWLVDISTITILLISYTFKYEIARDVTGTIFTVP